MIGMRSDLTVTFKDEFDPSRKARRNTIGEI